MASRGTTRRAPGVPAELRPPGIIMWSLTFRANQARRRGRPGYVANPCALAAVRALYPDAEDMIQQAFEGNTVELGLFRGPRTGLTRDPTPEELIALRDGDQPPPPPAIPKPPADHVKRIRPGRLKNPPRWLRPTERT